MAKELNENHKIGIDIDGDGKPDIGVSLKTIGAMVFGIISLAGVWFSLKSDIALAMEMPEPVIDRVEYDLKDELIFPVDTSETQYHSNQFQIQKALTSSNLQEVMDIKAGE